MDVILVSLAVILPVLLWSFRTVRGGGYRAHKRTQLAVASVLAVVVIALEMDLRALGGVMTLAEGGRFAGSRVVTTSLYVHLFFSGSTALLWTGLIVASLLRFPTPPEPNAFSRHHRFWGRVAMIDMVLTSITGIELYIVGLVL